MKKTIALLLAVMTLLSLCACGGNPSEEPKNTEVLTEATEQTRATTEAAPVSQPLSFEDTNILGEYAEVTFTTGFATDKLEAPMASSYHFSYNAASGNTFVVLAANVKNITPDAANVEDIVNAEITSQGGTAVGASCYLIGENGTDIDSYPSINALSTELIYFAFAVPTGSEKDTYDLTITTPDECIYTATFSVDQFEKAKTALSIGDTVSDNSLELTIENLYYSTTIYPPKMNGYYHYYEAESGKTYLILKATVKNLKGSDLKYDAIAGVSCVYNDKYNYSAFCIFEEDGGSDLNGYPGQYSISPLDSGVCYYLLEVPAEVQNGPTVVTIYTAGEYYSISAP